MPVFIGSTTPSQRACLSKEFKKLYAKKTFIPRKQKIAIALNTCHVGIKGVKDTSDIDIISVNYFGDTGDKNSPVYGENYNTKVHYKKYGKSYLATLYIDYYHGDVFIPKQPKGYKALRGITEAVKKHEKLRSR